MNNEGEWPSIVKVQLHAVYDKAKDMYELLLLELPKFAECDFEAPAPSAADGDDSGVQGGGSPLYYIDVKSTPPRLTKGNKEYLGRFEALQKPLLLMRNNKQDRVCSIVHIIRQKIVFDKGPIYHW
eukprot:Gregarina_sp_Pseudo_9__900@NODE_1577_length_1482_cov_77_602911_g1463_i0_p2_GENE_NODE_1577_length_1482_cov_77_602911_g1463_i0NODE_1577_length_1482_cov_77_602911_g1463_i0_p2_ORF_typecomplete_len126_score17_78Ctf8/PF09696_10/0_00014_NODE_1577_length_1482_cov_77_602911_g1463_i0375752